MYLQITVACLGMFVSNF